MNTDPPVKEVPLGAHVAETGFTPYSLDDDVSSESSRSWLANFLRGVLGKPGRHRRVGDRGAAMVEMAFVFSLLVMLLVGVTTTAIAFGQKNSIENAAREASRYAATYPAPEAPDTWQDWLETVRDVARGSAQGNLDPGVDGEYICVAHLGSGLKLEDVGGVESVSSGTCYDDGLSDPRVQVVTGRDTEISGALFSIDVTLDASASARYERAEE